MKSRLIKRRTTREIAYAGSERGIRKSTTRGTHLGVENEFGSFEQVQVPDSYDPIRFVDSHRVLVVSCDEQFGKLIEDASYSAFHHDGFDELNRAACSPLETSRRR